MISTALAMIATQRIYERARALDDPHPVAATTLAFAQADLVAEALVARHDHHGDCPCARCPKCVVRRDALVEAKLAAQAADRVPIMPPEDLWTAF